MVLLCVLTTTAKCLTDTSSKPVAALSLSLFMISSISELDLLISLRHFSSFYKHL